MTVADFLTSAAVSAPHVAAHGTAWARGSWRRSRQPRPPAARTPISASCCWRTAGGGGRARRRPAAQPGRRAGRADAGRRCPGLPRDPSRRTRRPRHERPARRRERAHGDPARGHACGRRARPDRPAICHRLLRRVRARGGAAAACRAAGWSEAWATSATYMAFLRPVPGQPRRRASTATRTAAAVRDRAAPLDRAPARRRTTRRRWSRTCSSSTRS